MSTLTPKKKASLEREEKNKHHGGTVWKTVRHSRLCRRGRLAKTSALVLLSISGLNEISRRSIIAYLRQRPSIIHRPENRSQTQIKNTGSFIADWYRLGSFSWSVVIESNSGPERFLYVLPFRRFARARCRCEMLRRHCQTESRPFGPQVALVHYAFDYELWHLGIRGHLLSAAHVPLSVH